MTDHGIVEISIYAKETLIGAANSIICRGRLQQ